MDYESFMKTAMYGAMSDFMKLQVVMYFLDPNNKGLTFTDLKKSLEGQLSRDEVSVCLDMGHDNSEIESGTSQRGSSIVELYQLDYIAKEGLRDIISLMP